MRVWLLVLILGMPSAIFKAQVQAIIGAVAPQQSAKRYTVSGAVSNFITGEPIRRALVQIGPSSAFTGADGRFQLEGLPEGSYSAIVQRPGFFDPGQAGLGTPPGMITVGPNTPSIALKLIPESVIQGRVLSKTGEPVENAQIQVIGEQIFSGRKILQNMAGISTDDAGEFRAEGLRPGKYYVEVQQHPVYGWNFMSRQVYPEQFYPNAPDLASAQALQLKPGENAEADFTLSAQMAARVSGVLAPAARGGIFVTLQDASGNETQANVMFNPRTGHWMLPFVPPGSWTIIFRAQDQPGDAYYAEQRVEVHNSDIEDLRVVLQAVPPIPVHVVNLPEGNAPGIQLRLIPQNGPRLNSQEYMAAPQNGNPEALAFQSVAPGIYRVAVQSNGQGCIDSVSSGSLDLMRDPLVVALGSAAPAIQVALRNDCASLDVTVQAQNSLVQQPLLLVAESPALDPKMAFVPGGSHTGFSALTPGTYRLYAVANVNNLEYTNPEAMRDLASQEITLAPNQQGSVTVNATAEAANE